MKYLFILPIVFLCSCVSLDKDFVRSVGDGVEKISGNYILYIQKDTEISDELKNARLTHLQELIDMINDAKKLVGLQE